MKTRWLALSAVVLATTAGLFSAGAASATGPLTLDPGYVTDGAGVLSGDQRATSESRLSELKQNSDIDLFVVFVDEFTAPADANTWANDTAELNGLGPRDLLLAVAVDQHTYALSVDVTGPISESQQDEIQQEIERALSSEDWDGAIVAAADEIQGDGGAGALRAFLIVAGLVALALVVWLVVALIRRSRRNAEIRRRGAMPEHPDPNDPFSTLTDEQVKTQAGSALVQADDALTSSREELGFAVAQFGEGATAEFTAAVDAAKSKLAEAFGLRQKLDDEIEDTVHEQRAWNIRIVQIADEIDEILDANTEAFDALRKLEQNAPQELERVRGERAALAPVLAGAPTALATLSATYAGEALSTVADNPAQAQERAALADHAIDAAGQAITVGRASEAAFAIRTAEQAVAQATQLVQAITALGADLAAVEAQAQALVAELQSDVAAAQQLPDSTGALATAASTTIQYLNAARTDLAGTARNPRRAFDALSAANAQIDAAIAQGREALERSRRTQQMLEQTLTQAGSEIRTAREFIETRRGTVGSTARTRLSQADTSLTQALSLRASSPDAALTEATRALDLARQATASASADVSAYDSRGYDGWGSGPFGSSGNSGGSGLGGDILGGIIGGLLAGGGGGSRSSSRNSSWRSSGGGGFRSSGFGGGRSGGSRSSGGGRRSGGGRF